MEKIKEDASLNLSFDCSQYSSKDFISTDDIKRQKIDDYYKIDCPLDSMQLINWTDQFVPYADKDYKSRLYSAYLYSIQPKIKNFYPLIVYSNADDWNKLHLLTIDPNLKLIDHELIGESQGWLLDQNEKGEIIGELRINGKMINSTEYIRYKVYKTIHDYSLPDTSFTNVDSVVTKLIIKDSGEIETEIIDSIKITNYAH